MCFVLKFDNEKVVSKAHEQTDRQAESQTHAVPYKYIDVRSRSGRGSAESMNALAEFTRTNNDIKYFLIQSQKNDEDGLAAQINTNLKLFH